MSSIKCSVIYFVIIYLIILSTSCSRDREYKTEKYPSGVVKSEIGYVNDTIQDGMAKSYYDNGVLMEEVTFVNGKKEGPYKFYYESGKIQVNANFWNDKKEGEMTSYFESGTVERKGQWRGDRIFGSNYFYNSKGILVKYVCADFSGKVMCLVKWNDLGIEITNDCMVFSHGFISSEIDSVGTVKINQDVTIKFCVAEPPKTKTKIWMGSDKDLKELTIENNIATYKFKYSKANKYQVITLGEIRTAEGELLKTDSATMTINAIDN